MAVKCNYCDQSARLTDGHEVYPSREDLWEKWFWVCDDCDARVGCHPGTKDPLGLLANSDLRQARQRAHAAFDRIWKDSRGVSRSRAYRWLALGMGLDVNDCHIARFDADQCDKVVWLCKNVPKPY